jgi:hypothetical protein
LHVEVTQYQEEYYDTYFYAMHIFDTAIPAFYLEIPVCAHSCTLLHYVRNLQATLRGMRQRLLDMYRLCYTEPMSLQLTVEPAHRVYISRVVFLFEQYLFLDG